MILVYGRMSQNFKYTVLRFQIIIIIGIYVAIAIVASVVAKSGADHAVPHQYRIGGT